MLLNNQYAPITSEIEFIECDMKTAIAAYLHWQEPIQATLGVRLKEREVAGDFPSKLESLLPLSSVLNQRVLFAPTTSRWTAYFGNGWRGNDPSAISYLCQEIGCRAIRALHVPHTLRKTPIGERGRYGATIFEVYSDRPCNDSALNIMRSIYAVNDGGSWKFGAHGKQFDFEDVSCYNATRKRDRFTPAMLDNYLQKFDIDFFSSAFYESESPACLISKDRPPPVGMREYTLQEARANY